MWHFVADTHLDHGNIIKYCKRPFLTATEQGLMEMVDKGIIPQNEFRVSHQSIKNMTETIIDSINATVRHDDTLVIGGDFCWTTRENRVRRTRELRNCINCHNVYLIWGNHDDRAALSPYFKGCFDQHMFNVNGQNIFMSP